jgi:Electron transfer DM13
MKKSIKYLVFCSMLIGCSQETPTPDTTQSQQNSTPQTTVFDTKNQTVLLKGTFESGAHPTSGTVTLYEDKDKKRTIVFENLKTDNGPDIRIWVAEDTKAKNYIEISDKVLQGNYYLPVSETIDFTKKSHVLIWCKQYTVLFGNAKLQ